MKDIEATNWASETMKRVDQTMLLEGVIVEETKEELFKRFEWLIAVYEENHNGSNKRV
jgi:hypothetical protein